MSELMKYQALVAVLNSVVMMVAEASGTNGGGPSEIKSGHNDISIYDLPEGSVNDLGKAMREYNKSVDSGSLTPSRAKKAETLESVEKDIKKIRFPQDYIYEVASVNPVLSLSSSRAVIDDSLLKLKPLRLKATASCELLVTQYNGVKLSGMYTGYAQFFKCGSEGVYSRDMLLEGVRVTRLKEQFNISIEGVDGVVYGVKDAQGKSYTHLGWISNNTDHVLERDGTGEAVRAWLADYAKEVIAQGR